MNPTTLVPRTRSSVFEVKQGHLRASWWAVSASLVSDWGADYLRWLRAYCPIEIVGETILIYRFETRPNPNLVGDDEPPSVCPGRFSQEIRRRARR